MRRLRAAWARLTGFLRGTEGDADLRAELESHVQMEIEDSLRQGLSPEDARRKAGARIGSLEAIREAHRDRRGIPVLAHLIQDLRFGSRVLRRNPLFTAVAMLTLGLGIGANTALFSVVNAVLLRPLPFPDASRLVLVWGTHEARGRHNDVSSYPTFQDWQAGSRSFESMAAFTTRPMALVGGADTELVPAIQATAGFFDVLAVAPARGRTFRAEEAAIGAAGVVVLSDRAWRSRFGGRADVLGQTIRANEQTYSVIGVMPPGFRFSPGPPEQLYVPLAPDPNRNHGFLRVLGRLRPDAQVPAAQAELDVLGRRLAEQYPESNAGVGAKVEPLRDAVAGPSRRGLVLFLGVVVIVLLIACANVTNLLLARHTSRQRELAVRVALGAGRARVLQQMFTETLLLALGGGMLGLLFSTWGTRVLIFALAHAFAIPRIDETRIDLTVLSFTFAVSLATGLLFGVVPAFNASSPDLNEGLRESSRSATASVRGRRLRSTLILAETALAVVLLAGAGVLLKSLQALRTTAPGFGTENVLAVNFWLPKSRLESAAERLRFLTGVRGGVEALPGVRSAALVANLPLSGSQDSLGFHIPGRPAPASGGSFNAAFNIVSPAYFRTMTIPVRAGREFTEMDSDGTRPVIVINETAARQFWPGEDPIGQEIVLPIDSTTVTLTVVGVVGDVRQLSLGAPSQPEIFLAAQQPRLAWAWLSLVVHTDGDPTRLAPAVKSIAHRLDRDVPIAQIRTLDQLLSGSLAQPRVYAALLATFAALALALVAAGLYGVVSYTVAQRTHEMGIRMALGAGRSTLLATVLRESLGLVITGAVIGLAGALALTPLLTHLVPEAQPGDPWTMVSVTVLLLAVGLAASYLPARQAARVDPVIALRSE